MQSRFAIAGSLRLAMVVCLTGLSLVITSCFSGSPPGAKRHLVTPVTGQIFINDRPAAGVQITFVPDQEIPQLADERARVVPTGIVDDKGNFVITTYSQDDGAPRGYGYKLKLIMPTPGFKMSKNAPRPDVFEGAYADPAKNAKNDAEHFAVNVPESTEKNPAPVAMPRIDLKIDGYWEALEKAAPAPAK